MKQKTQICFTPNPNLYFVDCVCKQKSTVGIAYKELLRSRDCYLCWWNFSNVHLSLKRWKLTIFRFRKTDKYNIKITLLSNFLQEHLEIEKSAIPWMSHSLRIRDFFGSKKVPYTPSLEYIKFVDCIPNSYKLSKSRYKYQIIILLLSCSINQ